jgi:hypothetical protein
MHFFRTAAAVGLFLLFSAAGSGCGKKADEAPEAMQASRAARAPQQAAGRDAPPEAEGVKKDPSPRKIVYTANVRLTVENFAKAEQELDQLLEAHKGYIIKSVLHGSPGSRRSGEWQVRVPVDQFKKFQAAVIKLGELESSSLDSQDVTEEFYDLKTRIKNREAREQTLRDIYKKATKVEELIPIDREIQQVRLEIEREQGRLQLLTKLTEMTTVTITIRERGAFVPPESASFGTKAGRTFSDSLGTLEQFGQGLALFAVALTPWLPLVALIAVPSWLLLRRRRPPAVLAVAGPQEPSRPAGEGPPASTEQ